MKQRLNILLAFLLFTNGVLCGYGCLSCNDCCNECCLGICDGYPFLQIRSQSRDTSRELCLCQDYKNKYYQDCKYGVLSCNFEYTKSFRSQKLAQFLFGNDLINCCELYIQGSQVENRNKKAWMADYFGLAPDYNGKVRFCPQIQNIVVDLNLWLGLDDAQEGLYIKINAPLVWTKWQLCPREIVCTDCIQTFSNGYMSPKEVPQSSMSKSFLEYMSGQVAFGDMSAHLEFGKIDNCRCSKTQLAEIEFALGWNFDLEKDHHTGAFLYIAAPAGTRPCGRKLFEPIVGNGKHWEFGGGLSASWIFSRSDKNPNEYMGLWIEATLAHLFKTRQCRSFDFCCKSNSRYTLLEEMTEDNTLKIGGFDNPASYVYKKKLIPAIHWSTCPVDVKIDIQADIALKFGYIGSNWNLDLGYNFWARTGEQFCFDNCACRSDKLYAIKGDAYLYGRKSGGTVPKDAIALSATQSLADIHAGKNLPLKTGEAPDFENTNPRVDNPVFAYATPEEPADQIPFELKTLGNDEDIKTSVDPILVSREHLNLGKSPSSITHKIFCAIGYANKEYVDYTTFLGMGGKVEFAQDNCNNCCCSSCKRDCNYNSCSTCGNNPCRYKSSCYNPWNKKSYCGSCDCRNDSCSSKPRGGLSQWGIWIKGGVAFN